MKSQLVAVLSNPVIFSKLVPRCSRCCLFHCSKGLPPKLCFLSGTSFRNLYSSFKHISWFMINNAKQPFHSLLHRLFDSTIFNYTLSYVTLVFYQTRLKNRKKSQLKDRNSVKKVIRANRIIRIILSRVENFIPEKRKKTKRKENCDEGEGEEIPSRMLSGTTLRLAEDKRLATNFKMPRIPMSFPFPFPSLFYIYISLHTVTPFIWIFILPLHALLSAQCDRTFWSLLRRSSRFSPPIRNRGVVSRGDRRGCPT